MIAWGEEEQSPRLSRHACVAARLSGFRDDECARQNSRKALVKGPQTFREGFPHVSPSKKGKALF